MSESDKARLGVRSPLRLLLVLVVLCSLPLTLLRWAAGPLTQPGDVAGEICDEGGHAPQAATAPATLRVMTWNIAYARGTNPDNRVNDPLPEADLAARLAAMGDLIRRQRIDIVLLQEVDFAARRSRYLDQATHLAQASGLRYSARAVTWRARYVPYPYWPPRAHYGRVVSGGAVLSRFPILDNQVTLLPQPASQPWWYNAFYLFRHMQWVLLQIGQQQFWIVNNHLEAFDRDNREQHARLLTRRVAAHQGVAPLLIVGGDLNSVPPEARQKHAFVDNPQDDYRGDTTIALLGDLPGLRDVVTAADYQAAEPNYFTYPTGAPTRRLDYLLLHREATLLGREVLPLDDYSDHLPLIAEFRLPATEPAAQRKGPPGQGDIAHAVP